MSINEKLLQILMAKNPDASFGLQESFPFKSTYADAAPLGPIMELRTPDGQNAFTPERAAQSLDYWRATTQQLLSDPTASASPTTLMTHSHDAVAAANLLAAHNYNAEAEQAYRLSSQLWPGNPEPVGGLSEILARTGRAEEAHQLLEDFASKYPDQRAAAETIRASWGIVTPKSPPPQRP
jgi:predicted Zn-dependent protease